MLSFLVKHMTAKKPTHGGKRKNSGRKKIDEPLKVRAVRLSDEDVAILKSWGHGDMSKGIRGLIEMCLKTWPKRTSK